MFPHHFTPRERLIWLLCLRLQRLERRYLTRQVALLRQLHALLESAVSQRP